VDDQVAAAEQDHPADVAARRVRATLDAVDGIAAGVALAARIWLPPWRWDWWHRQPERSPFGAARYPEWTELRYRARDWARDWAWERSRRREWATWWSWWRPRWRGPWRRWTGAAGRAARWPEGTRFEPGRRKLGQGQITPLRCPRCGRPGSRLVRVEDGRRPGGLGSGQARRSGERTLWSGSWLGRPARGSVRREPRPGEPQRDRPVGEARREWLGSPDRAAGRSAGDEPGDGADGAVLAALGPCWRCDAWWHLRRARTELGLVGRMAARHGWDAARHFGTAVDGLGYGLGSWAATVRESRRLRDTRPSRRRAGRPLGPGRGADWPGGLDTPPWRRARWFGRRLGYGPPGGRDEPDAAPSDWHLPPDNA
jgi:hypothetical protein